MNEGFLLVLVGLIGLGVGFAIGLTVGILRSSTSGYAQAPSQVPEQDPAVEPKLAETPATNSLPPPQTAPEAGPALPAILDESALPAPVLKRPTISPINVIARAIQADVPVPHQPERSIAFQVDEILQEMLKTSSLGSRAIRLMELPQKGMVVMIGLEQYDGVEAVPDEEIRQLLRAAVAEWERRVSGQEK